MSTLVRWKPAYRMRPRYSGRLVPYWDSRVAMPLDIEENKDAYLVKASVPGYTSEEVQIEIQDDVLILRAEREEENKEDRGDLHLRERFSGTVERRLRLGKDVDHTAIDAHLEHGVLTLTLPKAKEAKPKLIEVKAA